MGKHILNGRFVSERFAVQRRETGLFVSADKLVLSFHDPAARPAIKLFATMVKDAELARDIKARLRAVESTTRGQKTEDRI